MIFVGDDWSEDHHDVELLDESGKRLTRRRLPEGAEGMAQLHALVAAHAEEPSQVVVGIETERGLWWRRWWLLATSSMPSTPRP
jgi:hypothetical protein